MVACYHSEPQLFLSFSFSFSFLFSEPQLACRVAKFNGVHTLVLHIPDNFGADHTRITFIGIKGEFTEVSHLHPKTLVSACLSLCDYVCDLVLLCMLGVDHA